MPRKGSPSNSEQNKAQGGKELNPWLVERFAERASPSTARSTIGVRMSSLLPHSWQHHLGESSSRLARWAVNRAALAVTALRAAHLPLTSGASDFISRKFTLVPTVWQRMLNLTWVQQRQRRGHSPAQTAHATDWPRTHDTGRWSRDVDPARHVPTLPAAEEEHLVDKTAEAYPLVTQGPLPLTTTHLFSPPIARKELLGTTGELPFGTGTTAMPLRTTKQMVDRRYLNEVTRTVDVSREKHPVTTANEAYPAVIKNLFSPPALTERLPGTTHEPSYYAHTGALSVMTKRIAADQQTEDTDDSELSHGSQSRIPGPGIYQSKQIQNVDHSQIKGAPERLTQVDGQRQRTYLTQPLSQVLTPITRRAALQPRLIEAGPHLISEGHASPIQHSYHPKATLIEGESGSVTARQAAAPFVASIPEVRSSHDSAVPSDDTLHAVTGSQRPATLESKAVPHLVHSLSKPTLANEVSKRYEPSAVQRTARKPDGLTLSSLPHREVTPSEGSRVLLYGVASQPAGEVGQALSGESLASRSAELAGQEAGVMYTPANQVSKRFERPAVQKTASKPDELALSSLSPQEVTPGKGRRKLTYRVARQRVPELAQARTREPIISPPTKQAGQKVDVAYTAEDVASLTPRPDMPDLVTGVRGSMDVGFTEGYAEKLLSYRRPPAVTGSVIEPLPLIERISRTTTMPSQQLFKSAAHLPLSGKSEDYRFLQSRDYVPSSPSYKHARQPAPALPVTSSVRPHADFSVVRSEELFRHTFDTIPELAYSRNHKGLELALAPVSRMPETKGVAQLQAEEPPDETGGEEKAAPDIRALARELYPLMKRMILLERDRQPTWK